MPTASNHNGNGRLAGTPAVAFDGVSIRYEVPREEISGIKEFAIRRLKRKLEYIDVWALKDITVDVAPGEMLGILGPNGAGKSTFLKTVARVLHPTEGRVLVHGSVAPMLELGAGFHPELTGRENVFLYGALLGHARREIQESFEAIVEFAELADFIDAPLRVYSTGMITRLGFSVATRFHADILLIDEALAVGDNRFQAKCIRRLNDFRELGVTVLFVSHDLPLIQELCDKAIWLAEGQVRMFGGSQEVVERYSRTNEFGNGSEPESAHAREAIVFQS